MRTTIDSAGRVVIPKAIRMEASLQPGMNLDIRFRDGRVEIEPAPLTIKLVRRGHFLIAAPEKPVPTLRHDLVERTRKQLRREREESE